jgi:hypothetical protein
MSMNLNRSGIRTTSAVTPNSILFDVKNQSSVSVILANTGLNADDDGKKILKAGTPLYGDIRNRASAFIKASTSGDAEGVYTVQITTAFANDETITIEGVTYTKKATESVANKQFEGTTAANQITSLLKMVSTTDFTVGAVDGATDKLGFTQKVVQVGNTPVVTKTSSTGVIGAVTEVTAPAVGTSNAVAVLLHDVDVTSENANGTALLFGFVNLDRLDAATQALYDAATLDAFTMIKFLRDA